MAPSSADTGFFQRQPILKNQFHDDVSFQRVARLFLSPAVLETVSPELEKLGDDVLQDEVFHWITDSERNTPYLRGNGRDAFGKIKSELVVSEGWRKLQEWGFKKGVIAYNYDTDFASYTRVAQFLRIHLWTASCSNTTCPGAMQDGAARLLQLHLAKPDLVGTQGLVIQNAFNHLTFRDPQKAWTSGQWMTERTGGSDVSQTETTATYSPFPNSTPTPLSDNSENIPLGPWSITGFKWFSSATDSAMTILLAKTKPSGKLSALLAPMRRHNRSLVSASGRPAGGPEPNSVRIQRLKTKLGTQSLPTAELELCDMRGWLLGAEGHGIQEISTMLTITRAHSAVGSLGYLGRGLAVARAYALVREVGAGRGRRMPLFQHPLHARTLARMTGAYHGLMLLTFYSLTVLGLDERRDGQQKFGATALPLPPPPLVAPLLRALSSVTKAYVCERTVPLLFDCMRVLGGLGYLLNSEKESLNVAHLFRDACVQPIWEGTTEVLCSDVVRALKHPAGGVGALRAMEWFVDMSTGIAASSEEAGLRGCAETVRREWSAVKARVVAGTSETLLPEAKEVVFRLAEVVTAALYLVDATANPGPEIQTMCLRYLIETRFVSEDDITPVKGDLDTDLAIIYGPGGPQLEGVIDMASKL